METNYIKEMIEQATAFAQSGRHDLALNLCNVALDLIGADDARSRARLLFLRGQIAYKLNNHRGALDDLQQAIALDADLAANLSGEFSKFYKESCH